MLLAVMLVMSMVACTVEQQNEEQVEITLWTYPIGGWGNQATVEALLADFHAAYPNIKVTVEYLTYTDGALICPHRIFRCGQMRAPSSSMVPMSS